MLYPADVGGTNDNDLDQTRNALEETAKKLREAIQLWPARPEAHLQCVRALRALGKREEAEKLQAEASNRFPDFIPLRLRQIADLRAAGQAETAEELLKDTAGQELDEWPCLLVHAHEGAQRRDWDAVDVAYNALLAPQGAVEEAYAGFTLEIRLRRGRVGLLREAPHRAVEDFAVVASQWPRELGPAILLATAYYSANLREEAARVLDAALATTRLEPHAVARIADCHRRHGQRDRALAMIERIEDPGAKALEKAIVFQRGRRRR